ncbi:MAG: macro domain-containing protein [Planctomycetota bacterium]|nr:macro domain-containing protein [Planctomycetota bacterium]MDI6786772.1 macro domain-containing protein [Planctomycetota bacterium]
MKNVKVLVGDIFKSKAQTLVNTVNCVGIMGKGLALEFKSRFPDMFKDYEARCARKEVELGKPYLYKSLIPPWILLFPSKEHWRSVSNIKDIETGFQYLVENYQKWGITSLAVPPIGCGLGQLDWKIVGRTLYRYLTRLNIPIELYAPTGTPNVQLTLEFLESSNGAQMEQAGQPRPSDIESGFVTILEVLNRLEKIPYHYPIGRIAFQKLAYFGTALGLKTGLAYRRSSFGPFAPELKNKLTKLVNNGLIEEEPIDRLLKVKVGSTFGDAERTYQDEIKSNEDIIEKLTDLFCRLKNTRQVELASTVHFARKTMKTELGDKPTEKELLDEVMEWKKKARPPYDEIEVAKTIRNLAILSWLDVKASEQIPLEAEAELIV